MHAASSLRLQPPPRQQPHHLQRPHSSQHLQPHRFKACCICHPGTHVSTLTSCGLQCVPVSHQPQSSQWGCTPPCVGGSTAQEVAGAFMTGNRDGPRYPWCCVFNSWQLLLPQLRPPCRQSALGVRLHWCVVLSNPTVACCAFALVLADQLKS